MFYLQPLCFRWIAFDISVFYELTITVFLLPTVFQRLANDQFCNSNHCIVITVSMPLSLIVPFSLANDSHSSLKQPLLCFIHVVLCFFVFCFPPCRDVDILIFLQEGRVLYNFLLGVGTLRCLHLPFPFVYFQVFGAPC